MNSIPPWGSNCIDIPPGEPFSQFRTLVGYRTVLDLRRPEEILPFDVPYREREGHVLGKGQGIKILIHKTLIYLLVGRVYGQSWLSKICKKN